MWACDSGASAEVVKALIDKGAEVNKANRVREIALSMHAHYVISAARVQPVAIYVYSNH